MLVYLNGEFLPEREARVPVEDRGFIFGDGVYEVTRSVDGRLFEEPTHWRRLQRSLGAIEIDISGALDREAVREISERLLRENGLTGGHAIVYLQITRGAAPRTHWFPPAGTPPTVFLSAQRLEIPRELRERGADAITHPDQRWARCDLKTVNLLPNVLVKQRAHAAGVFEAILLRDGVVTEGTSSNVFGVLGGELRTAPLSNYILPGVTRGVVLELARERGLPVSEQPITLEELPRLDEVFLTGTTTDVQPLVTVDGRPVGTGRVGPIARALQEALYRRMAE
ncbi:MAG TPA: D-amino-acid transaminase [Longimicrobiaceae bacterium]|nr:D-amino-acid transaminase [Longimicrobiaceae bacterium]